MITSNASADKFGVAESYPFAYIFIMNTIKEIREQLGMNQTAFAERMGVKQATVSRWEAGINVSEKTRMAANYLLACSQSKHEPDAA